MNRRLIVAIAAIIAVPLIFAAAGGGQSTGVIIGIVLVVGGIAYGLLAPRDET